MTNLNNTPSARESYAQDIHYVGLTVAYNAAGISTGVRLKNSLPNGAMVLWSMVNVTAAFNAATTNVLTVGTNSTSYNDLVAAGDVNEGAVEATFGYLGSGLKVTADTDVYVKYTQTGTAATAGAADILVAYVNANNL